MTTFQIQHRDIPKTLNGHPVKAFTISATGDRALVLVCRAGGSMPWVAGTWFRHSGDEWVWGNYFDSYEAADEYRGNWVATHGSYGDDTPRVKLEGRVGGFQE